MRTITCALAGLGIALALQPAALRAAVPPAAQPALFDKVFGYDRALGDRGRLQVLLVRGAGDPAALDELEAGFRALGIQAEQIEPAGLAGRLAPGVVVYLTPETATPELLAGLAQAKVLSIGGDAALAESGRAAVALGGSAGKPDIVINLDRVEAEGHDFPAQFLKLARVVRGTRPAGREVAAGFTPPELLGLSKPPYPTIARRMRVEGDVVMRLEVDASGAVTGVEVVKGVSEAAGIDAVAVKAAHTARFKPAMQDGKPVPSSYLLTLPFRL